MEKNKNIEKSSITDEPIATEVIRIYKEVIFTLREENQKTSKLNKTLFIIIGVLALCLAVQTTYIIVYWDTMHPHAGAIQEKC